MKRLPRRGSLVVAVLLTAASATPGVAAERGPATSACRPEADDAVVTVASVSEDLDVTLADGRALRLAGIDPPRATPASPDLPARARRALEDWSAVASGSRVALHPVTPTLDRWGRVSALLVSTASPAASARPASAAEALVRAGLARARPEASIHLCFAALLAAEAEARTARRGLWADPRYAILKAADADGLADQAGDMALVEGILHLHEGRGAVYLALGRDRRGFAAVVSRRDVQRFRKAGLDLGDYDGTPVRLRGDLDARFGPRMRLDDPDGLESLEPGSIAEEPDAKHWTARARPR